jgi:hypothetical protein
MDRVRVLLGGAYRDLQSGNVGECIAKCSEVLRLEPHSSDAVVLVGLVAICLSDYAQAVACLKLAYQRPNENLVALFDLVAALVNRRLLTKDDLNEVSKHWLSQSHAVDAPGQLLHLLSRLRPASGGFNSSEILTFLETVSLPALRLILEGGNYDAALQIEMQLYNRLVKVIETESHFFACTAKWVPLMRAAGRTLAQPQLPQPLDQGSVPKVAFVFHVAGTEAHLEVVANILNGYRQLAEHPFDPEVYCLFGYKPEMDVMFAPTGVSVHYLDKLGLAPGSVVARLAYLRSRAIETGIDCVVWVSNPIWMAFAFAMRIARKQVWLAMKYHDLCTPDIDAYLTGGFLGRFRVLNGRRWRVGLPGYDGLNRCEDSERVDELRTELGSKSGKVIIGTYGRTEKLRDPSYLSSVCAILQRYPHVLYLWTGRDQDPWIQQTFEREKVAAQTRFIGWVDTRLYAGVLDVFLDSFPFPCGFTLYEAMMAAVPVVLMKTHESYTTGLHGLISPVLDGQDGEPSDAVRLRQIFALNSELPHLLLHSSEVDYVSSVCRLIDDSRFRRAVGMSCRAFAENYLAGNHRSGVSYSRHLYEIMEDN